MTHSLSRKELYDCVWSEPRKTLAQKFGVSDVAIGKACRKVGIPVPERGYWAKKQAGKKTVIPDLPPRLPGGSDKVAVGKYNQYSDWPSDMDILNKPLPQPPSFDEDLATVRNRVIKMVGKAAFHRIAHRTHPIIRKFLDQDEGRRKEYENNQYSWYEPKFDSPHEKRRLRILNAIFLAVESHGCKPYMSTSMYDYDNRDSSIHVGDQNVRIVLKTAPQKGRKIPNSKKVKKRFYFSIERAGHDSGPRHYWEDAESDRLESLLTTIVIEIIMTGELQYREYAQHRYTYLVEYKAELEEEERKKILEEEKKARDLRKKLEKERIDRLLADAKALQNAETIRTYVQTIISKMSATSESQDATEKWAEWALAQADRIDPLNDLSFMQILDK